MAFELDYRTAVTNAFRIAFLALPSDKTRGSQLVSSRGSAQLTDTYGISFALVRFQFQDETLAILIVRLALDSNFGHIECSLQIANIEEEPGKTRTIGSRQSSYVLLHYIDNLCERLPHSFVPSILVTALLKVTNPIVQLIRKRAKPLLVRRGKQSGLAECVNLSHWVVTPSAEVR